MKNIIVIYPVGYKVPSATIKTSEGHPASNVARILRNLDEVTLQMDGTRILYCYLHRQTGDLQCEEVASVASEIYMHRCDYAEVTLHFKSQGTSNAVSHSMQQVEISETARTIFTLTLEQLAAQGFTVTPKG